MNQTPSELLSEIHDLLTLNGENQFKIRAFERAAREIEGQEDLVARARAGTLEELSGIGGGIAGALSEFLLTGKSTLRDELRSRLPAGLEDLVQIPGLGPKKARALIAELKISSRKELEYACRENRLLGVKGFGPQAQAKILEAIRSLDLAATKLRIDAALDVAAEIQAALSEGVRWEWTGELRRRLEIVSELEILCDADSVASLSTRAREWAREHHLQVPLIVHGASTSEWGTRLVETTGSERHVAALRALGLPQGAAFESESALYASLNLPVIAAEARETSEIRVIQPIELRGIFHVHTKRSDGTATALQMAKRARELGFSYVGITDHSRSAAYAHGLSVEDLGEQERELRSLTLDGIRVLWGIESDILADGSLDYPDSVMDDFDLVIASIHSRFSMGEAEMTQRIVRAISHPRTKIIGHLTGRLLLGRSGYALQMETIVKEAAQRGVAIEINAHPSRLDIDWRWGELLRKHRCLVSINPDAHSLEGLEHTSYGISVAKKALLDPELVVNTWPLDKVLAWIA